ncbi:MAG TPA: IS4 family transposase [Streptosporangiaceae bacterium]|nr:IS4 family transposase [Streptosporangiaceae bacterium]
MRAQSATSTITRAVTVAGGVFAPGHLGELTQYLPFELVDDVLEQTRTVQRRLRLLPSRAGVYFVLALGMFPRLGYARVWGKLTAGLAGLDLPAPSEKALRDVRRRLGPEPLKALFEVVAGPLAQPHTPGVRFAGLRTVAFDGLNSVKVPDTSGNRAWLGKIRHRLGLAGYSALRLMALAETGTRGLLGVAVGSVSERDEARLARRLLHLLGPGMLILLDRAFDDGAFFTQITATGAALLARAKASRKPPVLAHLPDGSYLSRLDSRDGRHSLDVRIIEAGVAMTGTDGSRVADSYRLITTLTDHRRYPATALVRLYHERWEIESAFLALRHTLLDGRVLRSGDRPGAEQELWALLTLYQLLRMAMVTAVETWPGTNPDRASFTTALETARDQLTAAQGVCPENPADLPGVIGRAVLATLLPARRPRYSARKVKCATSRYLSRDDGRPRAATAITAITVTITTPPIDHPAGRPRPHRKLAGPRPPQPHTRRQRVTTLMATEPRDWSGRELAERLQIPARNLHTQLGEWAKLGFITRTGFAIYALNTPPDPESSTTEPDP